MPHVDGVQYLRRLRGDGFSDNPDAVVAPNSGYGALNLAYLRGAELVVLLGFDLTPGRCQTSSRPEQVREYPVWAKAFDSTLPQLQQRGVRVLNASPDSAITAYPRVSIDEALQELDRS